MSENKNSILPDVIEPLSNAIQQNIPETAKQTDSALSTVVGFFNNVVLYPVKKANLTFRYKLEAFENDLKEKTKNIPPENLQEPPIMIAGSILEALRYAYDETELREMYENLLASAMDSRIASGAHPSFVDTIRQLSPLDASVFKMFSIKEQYCCSTILFLVEEDKTRYYPDAMPDYFVEDFFSLGDPFLVSASLINLKRLGIIDITERGLEGVDYHRFLSHDYVRERKMLLTLEKKYNILMKNSEHAVVLNNYGKQFMNICLPNKGDR